MTRFLLKRFMSFKNKISHFKVQYHGALLDYIVMVLFALRIYKRFRALMYCRMLREFKFGLGTSKYTFLDSHERCVVRGCTEINYSGQRYQHNISGHYQRKLLAH